MAPGGVSTFMHSIIDVANETFPELITCRLSDIVDEELLWDQIKEWRNKNSPVLIESDDNPTHRTYITTIKQNYEKFAFTTPGKNKDERQIPNVDCLTRFSCDPSQPCIDHEQDKKYKFVFLVGKAQPHRLAMLTTLAERKLLDDMLISFRNKGKAYQHLFPEPLVLPDHYEWPEIINLGGYDSEMMSGSALDQAWQKQFGKVHPLLYRDTAISLVSEGTIEPEINFISEKTWIPMVAEHLMVFQANTGHRQVLEELGFKTKFDIIPDYDESDHEAIADVCSYLKTQSVRLLYEKTQAQRLHNRQLCLDEAHWKKYHFTQLKNFNWHLL